MRLESPMTQHQQTIHNTQQEQQRNKLPYRSRTQQVVHIISMQYRATIRSINREKINGKNIIKKGKKKLNGNLEREL